MNQRGFIATALLILLPLLLAVFVVISAAAFAMGDDSEIRHLCRVQLLRSQEQAAQKLNELIKLNGPARRLRISRKAAELAMLTAINPAALAVAQARLDAVIFAQMNLASKQKLLIFEGKRASLEGPANATRQISSALRENAATRSVASAAPQRRGIQYGLFDLIATPASSPTPDYQPSPDFETRQTTRLEVAMPIKGLLPDWLIQLLPDKPLKLKVNCLATIEKKENKWLATLKADKS
jgi:hypothetical protein